MNYVVNDNLDYQELDKTKNNYDESIDQAQLFQKNGNFHGAINEYLKALKEKPESVFILMQLALLSYDVKDFEKSIEYIDKAIGFGCDSHLIWYIKGAIYLEFNKIDDALVYLERALNLSPDFYPALVDMTSGLLKLSNDQLKIQKACEYSSLSLKVHLDNDLSIKVIDKKIKIPLYRIKHDLEQAKYLKKIGLESAASKILIKQLAGILGNRSHTSDESVNLSSNEYANLKSYYKEAITLAPIKLKNYLNPNLNWKDIENTYLYKNNEIIFIDNFLSSEALEWLIKYSLLSKVWLKEFKLCYLGAFANNGFMSEIHLNIAKELRTKLPNIIGDLNLEQMWGFKYDSKLGKGINVHADFAKINLNFWITPDKYNLNTNSGGMKVYTHPAPSDWKLIDYNTNSGLIYDYLKKNNSECITVPYKQNRAVLFNSALFHETDEINFVDEYEGRRVNITYLFGKQLKF
jgi:tetratricopeptide (TPR) repeat protein